MFAFDFYHSLLTVPLDPDPEPWGVTHGRPQVLALYAGSAHAELLRYRMLPPGRCRLNFSVTMMSPRSKLDH